MIRTLRAFIFALRGLWIVWKEELNFKLEVFVSAMVVFCLFYFHFSLPEILLCTIAITTILSAEIVNTAIEDLCDKVEQRRDPLIGKVKDISSAFVFVAGLGSFIVVFSIFYHHFF